MYILWRYVFLVYESYDSIYNIFPQARMNDIYTAQDTIQQYLEKFNEFRDPSFTGGNHP